MALIPNPQSEILREPNLLIPAKKPTGPVKVNTDHSIAKSCSAFFCPTPKDVSDLITGQTPNAMIGTWGVCNEGVGWRTSADGHLLKYPYNSNYSINGDFTLMWRGYIYDAVSGAMGFMGNRSGAYDNGDWDLYSSGSSSSSEIVFRIKGGGTLYTIFNTNATWPSIHPSLYTIIVTQQNSGTWKVYIQAGLTTIYIETDTDAGTFPFTSLSQDLIINERSDNLTDATDAIFLCGGIWQRALVDEEVFTMRYDPYQLLISA